MRLLYATIGRTYSPVSGQEVRRHTAEDVVRTALSHEAGTRYVVLAPLRVAQGRTLRRQLEMEMQEGYARIYTEGDFARIDDCMETLSEEDDGKDKTCFVAYSLGNFFSSQDSSYASGCESSVILNLQFTKNGETGETALTSVNYTPLYLMDRGSGADGAQYEILPIRTAIASGLFPDDTQTLTDAISRLRTRTESDFDSGK